MPLLTYGSETMIWKEKERSRLRGIQMDSTRGLLNILNARIRELCGVMEKVMDKRIDEGVLR